jgi:catechol 2,3-dioxygenase-like lactoylglutathione lyase family enzyme
MPATIDELILADDSEAWSALGFTVDGRHCRLGSAALRFAGSHDGPGILGWSLRDAAGDELDGLPTTVSRRAAAQPAPGHPPLASTDLPLASTDLPLASTDTPSASAHPNGAIAIDHVVAISPDLDRSVAALQAAGLDLRRVREQPTPAGAPRQAFFRLGREILEVIQEPHDVLARAGGAERPLRFWGLALLVDDLDRTAAQLAPHVGEVRPAVQPGRRIATVRRSAGLAVPLALISAGEREEHA